MTPLPADREAEQSCIAASILRFEAAQTVTEMLSAGDFWDQALGAAFEAIAECVKTNTRVNASIVAHGLRKHMDELEASALIQEATKALATPYGVEFWAEIVRTKAIQRRLIQAAANLHADAMAEDADVEQVISAHEASISAVRATTRFDDGATDAATVGEAVAERLEAFMANPRAIHGLQTGWAAIDLTLDGLQPQTLIGIGASTSVGKSLVCHNLIRQLAGRATDPEPVLIWTTEMSAAAVQWRLAWMEAGIDPQEIRRGGSMTREEKEAVWAAHATVCAWPVRYRYQGAPTIASIRAEVRRDKAKRGTKVFLFDHLGHISTAGRDTRERRTNAVRGLKEITMDEGICAVMTAHVNREGTKSGGWLGLTNFSDTSDIEKELDVGILITPCIDLGGSYEPIEDRRAKEILGIDGAGYMMWGCEKVRNGQPGMVPMRLDWRDGGGRFTSAQKKGIAS